MLTQKEHEHDSTMLMFCLDKKLHHPTEAPENRHKAHRAISTQPHAQLNA